jgi:uroporphyrinogen-III synthase
VSLKLDRASKNPNAVQAISKVLRRCDGTRQIILKLVGMLALCWLNGAGMKSKIVAILETRAGAHLADLITRRGGIPMSAPALDELPDIEPQAVIDLIDRWKTDPFRIVIFQTGVGTSALFAAADATGLTQQLRELLGTALVVVRGPKPVAALNARQIRIDIKAATPFTTETVLAALSTMSLAGSRVLVQRYGAANQRLIEELRMRGAFAEEITTYQWALPANLQPLLELLDALEAGRIDAVVFTSAVQLHNLFSVAEKAGRSNGLADLLNRCIVGSIGPVCSRALQQHGVNPNFEANPPKLGPLMIALEAALSSN